MWGGRGGGIGRGRGQGHAEGGLGWRGKGEEGRWGIVFATVFHYTPDTLTLEAVKMVASIRILLFCHIYSISWSWPFFLFWPVCYFIHCLRGVQDMWHKVKEEVRHFPVQKPVTLLWADPCSHSCVHMKASMSASGTDTLSFMHIPQGCLRCQGCSLCWCGIQWWWAL